MRVWSPFWSIEKPRNRNIKRRGEICYLKKNLLLLCDPIEYDFWSLVFDKDHGTNCNGGGIY